MYPVMQPILPCDADYKLHEQHASGLSCAPIASICSVQSRPCPRVGDEEQRTMLVAMQTSLVHIGRCIRTPVLTKE